MLTSVHEGDPTSFLVNRRHPGLAIFEISSPTGDVSLFYAAGNLAVLRGEGAAPRVRAVVESLEAAALAEEEARAVWARAPFSPTSLIVDFRSPHHGLGTPSPAFEGWLQTASRHVARNCRRVGRPFHVVLHAGDLSPRVLERTLRVARQCASEAHAAWSASIAIDQSPRVDLAQCLADGCGEIQVSCASAADLRSPALRVLSEKLARARRAFSVRLEARRSRLGELAEFAALAGEVGASAAVGTSRGFQPSDAPAFTASFLEAHRRARACGVSLRLDSIRIGEDLRPSPGFLEDEVYLPLGGPPSPSFRHPNRRALQQDALPAFDRASGELSCDGVRVAKAKARLGDVAAPCRLCFNAYHCVSYEFHDSSGGGLDPLATFECSGRLAVAQRLVLEAARDLRPPFSRPELPQGAATASPSQARHRLGHARVVEALGEVSSEVEVDPILQQWNAVSDWLEEERRALPEPVWTRRGFEHDGEEAWQVLLGLGPTLSRGPLAVYVHVPFCRRRCGFCDCYSEPLRAGGHGERDYLSAFEREIASWGEMAGLSRRAVTTVHFGGGTPGTLGAGSVKALVDGCRDHLSVHAKTEWAIESTASLLTDTHLDLLWGLGFRRLHVGVQTLDDPLRTLLGRREQAVQVVQRIRGALHTGFVVSVDLLYGIPGQRLGGLLQDVGRLMEAGVHGFSLYQLQDSNRNRAFLGRRGWLARNNLQAYLMFQVCEQSLRKHGYDKNHFTHFARPEDGNLYYTHPFRGEDLLGLGPSADGTFGGYRYRHAWIDTYASADGGSPGLEGGVWDSAVERMVRPLGSALMGGRVASDLFEGGSEDVVEEWARRRLLQPAGPGVWALTANGSWFLTRMLARAGSALGARLPSAAGQ